MPRFLIALCILVGLESAVRLQADDQPDAQKPRPVLPQFLRLNADQFIQRFDKNGDGYLTKDELPPGLANRFARFDTNGDGKLDRNEVAQMLQRLRKQMAGQNGAPPGGPANASQMVERIMARMDRNK